MTTRLGTTKKRKLKPAGRIRRVLALGFIAILGGVLLVVPATPAAADPLGVGGQYVINVPGELLAAAGSTMTEAAQLAATQTFDWTFAETQFAEVSGAFTATPAVPEVVLSPGAAAEFTTAATKFVAPAVKAVNIVKTVGEVSAPVLAFTVGTSIGSSTARLFGFKDAQVCQERSIALTVMAGVLDGVDCSAWEDALAVEQRNLDAHRPIYPNTCIDAETCWTFTNQVSLGNGNLYNCFAGPLAAAYVLYSTNGGTTSVDLSSFTALSWTANACHTQPGMEFPSAEATPVTDFQFMKSTSPYTLSPVEVVGDSGANPSRTWVCEVKTTTGEIYTQTSATWTEDDATAAAVSCPGIPQGKILAWVRVTEQGGGVDQTVLQENSTSAYQSWVPTYPECTNGSCPLLLSHSGNLCVETNTDCEGWVDDPDRDTDYTCTFGTHAMPLSSCFVYGPRFNPDNQASGHVYGNPTTGAPISTQTSPTLVDSVEAGLLARKWVGTADFTVPSPSELPAVAALLAAACVAQFSAEPDILIVKSNCSKIPIYAPGDDVKQATQHDLGSIVLGKPFLLHYESRRQKRTGTTGIDGLRAGWYTNAAYTCSGEMITSGPNETQCDEYPFYTTVEGGPGASLENINRLDNEKQGRQLSQFHSFNPSGCAIPSSPIASEANQFLVVPNPGTVLLPTDSVAICGFQAP